MTRDDIIRMAREAGAKPGVENEADMTFLECFATLVSAAEREACAKVIEDNASIIDYPSVHMGGASKNAERKAAKFADAIRARGQE